MESLELRQFIREKFHLERLPEEGDHLYDLAEESVAAMTALSPDSLRKAELESGCSGAGTPMIKKVLLLLAVKRKWGLDIPIAGTGEIECISDLLKYDSR